MTTNIPNQVARNRRSVKRIDGQFVDVPSSVQQNLRFLRNTIEVEVGLAVYTRPLENGLVSGHPDEQHGSGHGVAGDVRGEWTLEASTTASGTWTRGGRNAVRDALDGQRTGAISATAVGTATDEARPTDAALGAETGSTFAYGVKDAANEVRGRSHYLFHEAGDGQPDPQEFGLLAGDGGLMARATIAAAVVHDSSQEVRVDVTATVAGDGAGNSTVSDDGRAAVADAIQTQGTTIGLAELAWGTGTPDLDPSTASLAQEVLAKAAQRELDTERIEVSAPQFEGEPEPEQPLDYTEVAVRDNQGRTVWVAGIEAFPKDDGTRFTTRVGFRIR